MPINRYSQSRRAHLESKARDTYRQRLDKTVGDAPTEVKELRKEKRGGKRGDKKKR